MQRYILGFIIVSFFALTGFKNEVQVSDGAIPAEYAAYVAPYMGSYNGKFEKRAGVLEVKMNGLKPEVQFLVNGVATELVPGCQATVGLLDSLDLDGDAGQYELDSMSFKFDRGTCKYIEGTLFTLDFKHKKDAIVGLKASIYESSYESSTTICGLDTCYDSSTTYHSFLEGKFVK